jgi:hypothetical protein
LIPVVPLAFILPDPLFQPQQRASDADRDTAVDILCAAVAEGRLTLTELDQRVGAAFSARTICELAALIADLPGPWTPVPASASVGVSPPASPGWTSRAPERWSLLQSLAGCDADLSAAPEAPFALMIDASAREPCRLAARMAGRRQLTAIISYVPQPK